nr:MAG TPA: hypothetical protein [Caudoviricetes sp.]
MYPIDSTYCFVRLLGFNTLYGILVKSSRVSIFVGAS